MKASVKTAYLISCSDHYGHRLFAVDNALRAQGYQTAYITSDFDHTSKSGFRCEVPGAVQLHAMPYQKNLSIQRILSHYLFARNVLRYLEKLPEEPDAVVALIPPNFLAHFAAKYKKRHPKVRLIFDIFDLWPETFPSGSAKKLLAPVFAVWARIRDKSLKDADYITAECEMFRRKLGLSDGRSETIYLCGKPLADKVPAALREDRLDLCYLGAINNVIGIADICALIRQLAAVKPVTLHIVGKGERQQAFIDGAKAAGAELVFYGPVYDDRQKQAIMSRCHFGLNIMKSSVCVGLTMKSIDYFRNGIPIINSIPADTQLLVEQEKIGIQWGENCAREVLACSRDDCMNMRANVQRVFESRFAETVIHAQYQELLNKLL